MPDIVIHVLPADAAEGRAGTFLGPPPLVRIKKGVDTVTFKVTPADFEFEIMFPAFSPLDSDDAITDDNAGPFNAVIAGQFHYQVSVTDPKSGERWVIANCPELGVDR